MRWGRGVRIGFLAQNPVLPGGTVREAVGGGWQGEAMLDRLGMAPLLDAATGELSGGEAKRTALAGLLVGEHEVLILDEPTNHLDLDAIQFLEDWLAAFRGGLVLVTHDRHVLDKVTTKVLELDRGTAYLHVPTGWQAGSGYAAYLAGRAEREERAEVAEQVRKNLATRELAWLRRGAPARTSKPKARIATATALVEGRAQAAAREGDLGLAMGSKRLGTKGIELIDVSFTWPDGTPDGNSVIEPCSLVFEPGDRVGVVGANGAGKSTLLDLLAGRLTPTTGRVDRGATVQIGYYDQLGRDLDLTQRVRDAVAGDKGEPSLADVGLMRRFWFDGDAQFAPIGTLSGGERRRLQLLLTLVPQPNVLLLDEPTNDLDLDTLRALEDFLDDWPGIVVTVSHDRAFLDRVTDELLALDGRGGVRWVRGGVSAWLAQRAAATRHRPRTLSLPSRGAWRQRQSRRSGASRRSVDSSVRPNAIWVPQWQHATRWLQSHGVDQRPLGAVDIGRAVDGRRSQRGRRRGVVVGPRRRGRGSGPHSLTSTPTRRSRWWATWFAANPEQRGATDGQHHESGQSGHFGGRASSRQHDGGGDRRDRR